MDTKHTPNDGESESDFMQRCISGHDGDAEQIRSACARNWQTAQADKSNPMLADNRRKLGI